MKDPYRAVLCGLGRIAWRIDQGRGLTHASAYAKNPCTALKGGCSPDRRDREAFEEALGLPAFENLEDLLEAIDPHVVSICSPSECHHSQALLCLDRGIPMIWLEKPPAGSLKALDALIARQAELGNRSTVLVNYTRRYVQAYGQMRRIYREALLGKPEAVQISYSRGLALNGSHMLDMLFFLFEDQGAPRLQWVSEGENPTFFITFEKGLKAVVSGHCLPYHCIDLSLVCEKGRASIVHGGQTPRVELRVEHELYPGFHRLEDAAPDLLGRGGLEGHMDEALADLIAAHEEGRAPRSSLETARPAQALMEQILSRGEVLFAAGDVGGARALVPVIHASLQERLPVSVFDHGAIHEEGSLDWPMVLDGEDRLRSGRVKAVVFTSSVKDTRPLSLARKAKDLGIPVIHLLDHWTGYAKRMETDGLPPLKPDLYLVMDDLAFEEALEEGIGRETLLRTGQPAFASLAEEYAPWMGSPSGDKLLILFVSEPIEQDQGKSRGYTEKTALSLLAGTLQPFADALFVNLLPHPREDPEGLLEHWKRCRGALEGRLLPRPFARQALFRSHGIAGMASIMLYEAWLLNKPVFSLQPGLRIPALRMLKRREGVVMAEEERGAQSLAADWIGEVRKARGREPRVREELKRHQDAPARVTAIIREVLKQGIQHECSHHPRTGREQADPGKEHQGVPGPSHHHLFHPCGQGVQSF